MRGTQVPRAGKGALAKPGIATAIGQQSAQAAISAPQQGDTVQQPCTPSGTSQPAGAKAHKAQHQSTKRTTPPCRRGGRLRHGPVIGADTALLNPAPGRSSAHAPPKAYSTKNTPTLSPGAKACVGGVGCGVADTVSLLRGEVASCLVCILVAACHIAWHPMPGERPPGRRADSLRLPALPGLKSDERKAFLLQLLVVRMNNSS